MNKVPQITLAFWIMKISATTLGETAGDLLSMTLNVGYAVATLILLGIFLVFLLWQLMAKSYHPFLYWAVILATSTAGTTMSDYMGRTLGLGYAMGALILSMALVSVLAVWRINVGTLSVIHIHTFKVEAFYWTAILVSNTLGTALGDYLADSSGLGFSGGALLISALIGLIAAGYFFTNISRVALFWMAFVLTRPLGATGGDLLTKTHEQGGFGFGTVGSSAILAAVLVGVIVYSHRAGRETA